MRHFLPVSFPKKDTHCYLESSVCVNPNRQHKYHHLNCGLPKMYSLGINYMLDSKWSGERILRGGLKHFTRRGEMNEVCIAWGKLVAFKMWCASLPHIRLLFLSCCLWHFSFSSHLKTPNHFFFHSPVFAMIWFLLNIILKALIRQNSYLYQLYQSWKQGFAQLLTLDHGHCSVWEERAIEMLEKINIFAVWREGCLTVSASGLVVG